MGTISMGRAKADGFNFPTNTGSRRNQSTCAHLTGEGTSVGVTGGGHGWGKLLAAARFCQSSCRDRTWLWMRMWGKLTVSWSPSGFLAEQLAVLPNAAREALCPHPGSAETEVSSHR